MQAKATQRTNFSLQIKQATDAWALAIQHFCFKPFIQRTLEYRQNICSCTYSKAVLTGTPINGQLSSDELMTQLKSTVPPVARLGSSQPGLRGEKGPHMLQERVEKNEFSWTKCPWWQPPASRHAHFNWQCITPQRSVWCGAHTQTQSKQNTSTHSNKSKGRLLIFDRNPVLIMCISSCTVMNRCVNEYITVFFLLSVWLLGLCL